MRRNACSKLYVFTICTLVGLLLLTPLPGSAAPKATLIIRIRDRVQLQALTARYGLNVLKASTRSSGGVLVVEGNDLGALKARLSNDPSVQYVEKNVLIPLDGGETVLPLDGGETVLPLGETVFPLGPLADTTTTQNIYELLDGGETVLPLEELERIKAAYEKMARLLTPSELLLIQPSLRKIGLYSTGMRATGRGVIVADLDTGADSCHPMLMGVFQFSFVPEAGIPENCPNSATVKVPGYGHGTAVGSLIRMVAPEATLWSLRVFDSTGTAQVSDVAEAIIYAVDGGARVINMSFGTSEPSQTLKEAVDYAFERGVILVAAAGNSGTDGLMYPAAYSDRVKGIVTTDIRDRKPPFSNYGFNAALSAPGVKLLAAYPNSSVSVATGTSYSSPLVAGEAALVLDAFSRKNRLAPTRFQIDLAMTVGAQSIDSLNPRYREKIGRGRIYLPLAILATGR